MSLLDAQHLMPNIRENLCVYAERQLMTKGSSVQMIHLDDDNAFCAQAYLGTQVLNVVLLGAGHIARALVPILAELPINVYWVDDRAHEFDRYARRHANVQVVCDDFIDAVDDLPSDAYYLVITYSHAIDFAICEKLLKRDDFSYLGLIGSAPKALRFRKRLLAKGLTSTQIDKLICPIGVKLQTLKSPMAVAVSIAMDLLYFLDIQSKQTAAEVYLLNAVGGE